MGPPLAAQIVSRVLVVLITEWSHLRFILGDLDRALMASLLEILKGLAGG